MKMTDRHVGALWDAVTFGHYDHPRLDEIMEMVRGLADGSLRCADSKTEPPEIVNLARFGGKILRYSRGEAAGCDVDGGDIQDWALELGLLEKRTVTEPCGDECVCAEWSDFPQECYFENEAVSRWLSTPEHETGK